VDVLGVEDIIPLEEFAGKRREFAAAHRRYLDRYRRVRLGPSLTLVFENRQTLWFRVQEVLRLARVAEPRLVKQELDLYNRLLPGRDRLQAALLIAVDETRLGEDLAFWRDLRGDQLTLRLGPSSYPADLLTCRPEDRSIGAAHWIQFVLDADGRRLLTAASSQALLCIDMPGYAHDSGPLGEEVRRSLGEDLTVSARAG
jgi:hypothetical protein